MPACRRLAINVFALVSWLCISACEKETAPAPAGDVVAAAAGAGQEDVVGTTLADEFPSSLAFLPDGSIVFTQDNGQEVWRADTTGKIRWRVRRLGEGPGEYRVVQHLVPLPDSQIGVVDELRGRFQVWGANGALQRDTLLQPQTGRRSANVGKVIGHVGGEELLTLRSDDAVARTTDSLGLDTTFVERFVPGHLGRRLAIARIEAVASTGMQSFHQTVYSSAIAVCDSGLLHVEGNSVWLRDKLWRIKQQWSIDAPLETASAVWTDRRLAPMVNDAGRRQAILAFMDKHRSRASRPMTPRIDAVGRLWYRTRANDAGSAPVWRIHEFATVDGSWRVAAQTSPGQLVATLLGLGARHAVQWTTETDSTESALRLVPLPGSLAATATGPFGRCQPDGPR